MFTVSLLSLKCKTSWNQSIFKYCGIKILETSILFCDEIGQPHTSQGGQSEDTKKKNRIRGDTVLPRGRRKWEKRLLNLPQTRCWVTACVLLASMLSLSLPLRPAALSPAFHLSGECFRLSKFHISLTFFSSLLKYNSPKPAALLTSK